MPITQTRLLTLLLEHEDCLTRVRNAASALGQIIDTPPEVMDWTTRKVLLQAHLADLRAMPDKWAIVERERLRHNWKRNEKMKEKMTRRRRNAGISARPERGEIGQSGLELDANFEADYEAFNRGKLE